MLWLCAHQKFTRQNRLFHTHSSDCFLTFCKISNPQLQSYFAACEDETPAIRNHDRVLQRLCEHLDHALLYGLDKLHQSLSELKLFLKETFVRSPIFLFLYLLKAAGHLIGLLGTRITLYTTRGRPTD